LQSGKLDTGLQRMGLIELDAQGGSDSFVKNVQEYL
jgi:hypothetical protein